MANILGRLSRKQLFAVVGVLVAVIGVVVGLAVTASSKNPPAAVPRQPISTSNCPLTDLPAPGGVVPQRPALAVKIGNEPPADGNARPQSGLNEADIVYDTPAEGFIMRYMAVFQCSSASSVGPVRSVRWVDWHLLGPYGHPILTFAGGINPDVNAVSSLGWVEPANLLGSASSAGTRITTRSAPDNLFTSTSALYGLFKTVTTPPLAVFQYSTSMPSSATPVSTLAIDFSAGTDVLWKWDGTTGDFVHTYAGSPDVDALTHAPVSTTNIVVQIVKYKIGPYAESTGGSGDIESQTVGTGDGYVLRDGKSIKVTWSRHGGTSPTTFTDASGQPVQLAPGRTWVELVPEQTATTPGALVITK